MNLNIVPVFPRRILSASADSSHERQSSIQTHPSPLVCHDKSDPYFFPANSGCPLVVVPIVEECLTLARDCRRVVDRRPIPRDLMQVRYDGNSVSTVSPSSTNDSPQMTLRRFLGTQQYTIESVLASAKVADRLPISELRASGV